MYNDFGAHLSVYTLSMNVIAIPWWNNWAMH